MYFFREPPKPAPDYQAGSKAKKVNATSLLKPPNYKINKGIIKYKANTIIGTNGILQNDGNPFTAKGGLYVTPGETYSFWQAATVKKAATAKQTVFAGT